MTEVRPIAFYCDTLDGGSTAKTAVRLSIGFAPRDALAHLLVNASRIPIPERIDLVLRIAELGRIPER